MKTNSKVNYKKGMVAATVATLLATYGVTTAGATMNTEAVNDSVSINDVSVVEETTVTGDVEEAVVEDTVNDVDTDAVDVIEEVTVTEEVSSPSEEVVAVAENTRSREVLPGTLWDYLPLGDYFYNEKSIAICSEIGGTTFYMVEIMKDDSMEIIQTFESKTTPMFDVIDGVSYFVVNDGSGYEVLSITIDGATSKVPFKNGADTPARDVTFIKTVDGNLFVASLGELDYNGLGITYVSEYNSDLKYMGSYAINPTVIDPIHFVRDIAIVDGKVVIVANGKDFTFDRVTGGETEKPPVDNGQDNNGGDNNNNGGDNGNDGTEKPPVDNGGDNNGETEKPQPPIDGGNGQDQGNGGETEKPEPPVDGGNGNDGETEKPPVDNGDQDNNGGQDNGDQDNNGGDQDNNGGDQDNGDQDNNGGQDNNDGNQDNNGSTDNNGSIDDNQNNNGSQDNGSQDNNQGSDNNQNNGSTDNGTNPSVPVTPNNNGNSSTGTTNGNTTTVPTLPQTGQLPVGAFAGLASIFSGLGLFIKNKRK